MRHAGDAENAQHAAVVGSGIFGSAAYILLRQIDRLGFEFNSNVFAGYAVEFLHHVAFGDASLKPDTAGFDRGTHYRMSIVMTDAEASALEDS